MLVCRLDQYYNNNVSAIDLGAAHPFARSNFPNHDTTLTNVAAGRGVCLAPGFLNDHSGQFAWIPFDCRESFSCVLCSHREDNRPGVKAFIDTLKKLYTEAVAFPF